ncbi:MAG TPA: hypothetical protein DDW49_07195 [Deltaproteobacteria bacterium]|nr:MAG: hypothetical protein A2048_00830 [Deltaproteobacteria bacterium GWA2_45_12]HBF13155.1 hypothetical protein [Deltaproteobacteria bacterium]
MTPQLRLRQVCIHKRVGGAQRVEHLGIQNRRRKCGMALLRGTDNFNMMSWQAVLKKSWNVKN